MQALIGLSLYLLVSYFHVSLLYIIIGGAISGIILGKVFCRWMCPIGFIMELLMGSKKGSEAGQMYQYHKMGCPIAWVGGFFNKFSLFRIQYNKSKCNSCGLCDKNCYISSLNDDFSLFKETKKLSSSSFSCSRCLECVSVCGKNSLKFSFLHIKKK
ncbi:MAG: 4Fe-4S binding protein [Spirochaetaceae bacterium]|nr:4Fe-4S binding protein [Spirochaetaceae bacterium]